MLAQKNSLGCRLLASKTHEMLVLLCEISEVWCVSVSDVFKLWVVLSICGSWSMSGIFHIGGSSDFCESELIFLWIWWAGDFCPAFALFCCGDEIRICMMNVFQGALHCENCSGWKEDRVVCSRSLSKAASYGVWVFLSNTLTGLVEAAR